VDRPETDSARLLAAGARRVFLTSPSQQTSIERLEGDRELEEIVVSLDASYDLVVAEGFKKGSGVPKVLVVGKEELRPEPRDLIAVVGEAPLPREVPTYLFHELDRLALRIQSQFLVRREANLEVSLVVDGRTVPLAEFPSRILAGVVRGFLGELKQMPHSPRRVQLAISFPAPSTSNGDRQDSVSLALRAPGSSPDGG